MTTRRDGLAEVATMTKRAALYARVSTDRCELCKRGQKWHVAGVVDHKFKGQNPERQLREMRIYAASKGWTCVEFVDRISGAEKSRPQLDILWAQLKAKKFKVLIVDDYDRFARSTVELLLTLDKLNALDIAFVALKRRIDTSTPEGRLMFTIIAGMAEFERSLASQRVISGMENARALGKHLGRRPSGLDASYIRKRRAQGVPWRTIAAELHVSRETCRKTLLSA